MLVLISPFLFGKTMLPICLIIYGVYTIIIAALSCEHFICGMQNASHAKMTPYQEHPAEWLREDKREGVIMGIMFTVIGFIMLTVFLLEL